MTRAVAGGPAPGVAAGSQRLRRGRMTGHAWWVICRACREQRHEQCRGGNWCDCQHRPPTKTPPVTGPPPTFTPSARMLTLVPLVEVPVNVGVLTLVIESPLVPESLPAASVGVDGAVSCTTTPLPLSATVCGELGALSANDRLPVRAPEAAGLKATVATQL